MFITMTSDGERSSKREAGKMAAFKTRSQQKGTQMFPSGGWRGAGEETSSNTPPPGEDY